MLENSGQTLCCVEILAGTPEEDVTVVIIDQPVTATRKLKQLHSLLNTVKKNNVHDSHS